MRGPSRILFFDHTAMLGGGEIALLNLVSELDRGRYVPVVALASDGPLAERVRAAGVETHVLPLAPSVVQTRKDSLGASSLLRGKDMGRVVKYAWRLAQFLKEGRYALIHTNSLKADIIGGIAGRLAGIPVLWHVRDRIADDYLPKAVVRVFRVLCRLLPSHVVANSNSTLATLPYCGGSSATAIPSGLKVEDDAAGRQRVVHDGLPANVRAAAAAAVEQDDGPRRVALVGRIAPWKGQHVFLRAAAAVRERHPQVRFQIIGSALFNETVYEAEVKDLAASLGMNGSVQFLGFRNDVPELIAGLEVLVHASTTPEPFGQVVAEGMLAGKPVVATRGGGVLEVVQDRVTGLLVPMNDSDSMATAICELLEDPARAHEMGQRGRQRVLENFTIAQTAEKIQRVYDHMLRGRRGSSR